MSKTLTEARKELDEKREGLAKIFEQAGPELDMDKITLIEGDSKAKAGVIKKRNEELTELGKEVEALISMAEIAKGIDDMRKEAQRVAGGPPAPGSNGGKGEQRSVVKSLGQMFVESQTFKKFSKVGNDGPASEIELNEDQMKSFGWDVEGKTLLNETGFAPESTRTGLILPGVLRRPVVADLIPGGGTNQNAIKYMEETTTTNATAAVAEGGDKPESALAFTERSSNVRKLATVLPVTDELFEDEPAMRAYVEARLRLFLELTEETQLISGNGTAPNLRGMLNISGILTQAKGTDPVPDAVYKAITAVQVNSFLDASGAIFHPNDWQDIRLLRTTDGIYIWGSPSEAGPERIWGLPIVKTTAMTENTAIVAAFNTAMQLFRRNQVAFSVSDQHSDFFIKNQLMLRVEERLAFVVYRPTGICTVTGI